MCLIISKKSRPLRVSLDVCNLGVTKPLNIQTMHFTKVQISELMRKYAEKENALHEQRKAEAMYWVYSTLVEDLRDIFRIGLCDYTIEMVWEKW